jgi:hypothetical protein
MFFLILTNANTALSVTTQVARERIMLVRDVDCELNNKCDQCDNEDKAMLLAMT